MGRLPRFERLSDCPPPLAAAAALARRRHAFFLDSAMSIGAMGRYSFAGCAPSAVFTAQGRRPDAVDAERHTAMARRPHRRAGRASGAAADRGRRLSRSFHRRRGGLPQLRPGPRHRAPAQSHRSWPRRARRVARLLRRTHRLRPPRRRGLPHPQRRRGRRRAEDGPPSPLHSQRRAARKRRAGQQLHARVLRHGHRGDQAPDRRRLRLPGQPLAAVRGAVGRSALGALRARPRPQSRADGRLPGLRAILRW